jgi:hypothetical protein
MDGLQQVTPKQARGYFRACGYTVVEPPTEEEQLLMLMMMRRCM